MKNFQKVPSRQRVILQETMSVTCGNSLGKVVFFWISGIQILKIPYMLYLGKVFEKLTDKNQNFQRFKTFRRFRVFVLSYRANSKTHERRKI